MLACHSGTPSTREIYLGGEPPGTQSQLLFLGTPFEWGRELSEIFVALVCSDGHMLHRPL